MPNCFWLCIGSQIKVVMLPRRETLQSEPPFKILFKVKTVGCCNYEFCLLLILVSYSSQSDVHTCTLICTHMFFTSPNWAVISICLVTTHFCYQEKLDVYQNQSLLNLAPCQNDYPPSSSIQHPKQHLTKNGGIKKKEAFPPAAEYLCYQADCIPRFLRIWPPIVGLQGCYPKGSAAWIAHLHLQLGSAQPTKDPLLNNVKQKDRHKACKCADCVEECKQDVKRLSTVSRDIITRDIITENTELTVYAISKNVRLLGCVHKTCKICKEIIDCVT